MMRLLAASVSVLALGTAFPEKVSAANTEGVRQDDFATIAINLYEVDAGDPPQTFGAVETVSNPGGPVLAEALVLCAGTATCSDPGAIEQFALGSQSGSNTIVIEGSQAIQAEADAMGATATAAAFIDLAVWQVAAGGSAAANAIEISGLLDVHASANAVASQGSAVGFAAIGAGFSQIATALSSGDASNSLDNSGTLTITAEAVAEAEAGSAIASAFVSAAVIQESNGIDSASADLTNSGTLTAAAEALAVGGGGVAIASASALGVTQFVQARTLQIANTTTVGGIVLGVSTDTPSGPAIAQLDNSGTFSVAATATASGDFDATAAAIATGVLQFVSGSSADASIQNSGAIAIDASANVEGSGTPRAAVFVAGITQIATALAYSTVESIQPGGTLTLELSSTPVGPAVASLTNSGTIAIGGAVNVAANGTATSDEGVGVAFVDGIDQFAIGSGVSANIDNSGSLTVAAEASVVSGNVSNGVAVASGIDQFATAYAVATTVVFASGTTTPTFFTGSATPVGPASATLDNSGSLTVLASVESDGAELAFAGATASVVGQFADGTSATVAIDNSGELSAAALVSSHGNLAFGGAGAIGIQQAAQGTSVANVDLDNGGTIAVSASVMASGVAGGFVNATAFGVAQLALASWEATAELSNDGTLDIRAVASGLASDGSGLAFAAAHGIGQLASANDATVHFENSGTYQLLAQVNADGDEFALASATASGAIQQIGLGTGSATADLSIDNSGSIFVGAIADVAAGSTAVAAAVVSNVIVQSVVTGGGGAASLTNSGTIDLVADAEALAAGGDTSDTAFAQAFVSGLHASVSATGTAGDASVSMINEGSISLDAIAHATGSGRATAQAGAISGIAAHAFVAGTGDATIALTNSGDLNVLGLAESTGGHTAHATGVGNGAMIAAATGLGLGDADASITNSGSILVRGDAHAEAGTNAVAFAVGIGGFREVARAGTGDALASVDNSGSLDIIANATASALNAQAFAFAGGTFLGGAVFQSAAAAFGSASAVVDNSGSISIVADALANGEVIATASAVAAPGVNIFAFASSGDAVAAIANEGTIEIVANADANATNSAYANALIYNAVAQFANANGADFDADVTLANEGSISLAVVADASAPNAAGALAIATHEIAQAALAIAGDANLELDNSGSIDIGVAAIAHGSIASAQVAMASALYQSAAAIGGGDAEAVLDNSGSIDITGMASAVSLDGAAGAVALLDGAITQYAGAGSSQYTFGSTGGGLTTIVQTIFPTGSAGVRLDNSGSIDIAIAAAAEGGTFAAADGTANGLIQQARGTDADASIVNEGSLSIALQGSAEAGQTAAAVGSLTGIVQAASAVETVIHITATPGGGQVSDSLTNPVGSAHVSLTNSGTLEVIGVAQAEADTGTAVAQMAVRGVQQSVRGLDAEAAFANSGDFIVGAVAEAAGGIAATASATALGYEASGSSFEVDFNNSGDFSVIAEATVDAGAGQAKALATGIAVAADGSLGGTITNSGTLIVSAQASDGLAAATGIRVTDSGVAAADPDAVVTITNDGGAIIVHQSNDGGDTWLRGIAIDVAAAPNASVVNLLGDGAIYGNIDVADGDTINVAGGETMFDGVINPECIMSSGCGQGTLNIANGGALFLRHNAAGADGPSHAFVEQLNIAAGGSLVFELPISGDAAVAVAAYPQVLAGVANLDGALLVRPNTGTGLLADEYFFDNVIDANVRNGQFDACGIDGDPALLQLSCIYDNAGNVDLGLVRIAFNAVAGLGRNQTAVASGIEALYDVDLTGPFGRLVAQLFTFDDDEYRDALTQLTGASYAAYLQSFHSLGVHYNELLDQATDCERPGRAGSALDCRAEKVRLWGQIDVSNRRDDGDSEAPGYDADRWAAVVGADVSVSPQVVIGASLAKVSNHADFSAGATAKADGYQLGAYAVFDLGAFYAKAVGTLSWFDGDAERRINWAPLGGTLAGQLSGDPDVRLWTVGAHFGYRVAFGDKSLLTPYVNIDHGNARLDGFTETGLAGANLSVKDSTARRTTVTVGAKWAADFRNVVPQAELGYRYNLGERRASFDAAFLGDDDSRFEIVSAEEKRGSLLAGIGIGGKAGPVNIRVGYEGLFSGDATTHSGNVRIVLPLGGR